MEQGAESPKARIVEKPTLDLPIKRDVIDSAMRSAKAVQTGMDAGRIIALGMAGTLGSIVVPEIAGPSLLLSLGGLGAAGYSVTKTSLEYYRAFRSEKKDSVSDHELGYRADRLVYRGKTIDLGRTTLAAGDNLYEVGTPYLRQTEKSEQRTSHEDRVKLDKALERLVMKDLQKNLSHKNYKAVSFAFRTRLIGRSFNDTGVDILEGKNTTASEPRFTILSKEEFEQMSFEPNEMFQKIVDALEQKIGNKIAGRAIIEELRGLSQLPPDRKLEAAQKLRLRVDNLFSTFAEARFNGLPNVTLERDGNNVPQRKRGETHPVIKITTNPKGVFLEQITYAKGDRRTLVKLDVPLEQALNPNSPYQTLLLIYALSQNLRDEQSIEDATTEQTLTKEEVLQKIEELGFEMHRANTPRSGQIMRPKKQNRIRDLALATAIGTGAITAAADVAANIVPNVIHIERSGPSFGKMQGAEMSLSSESQPPNFPEGVPQSHMDWKIETFGSEKPEGYYILSTSNTFKDGRWVVEDDPDSARKLDNGFLYSNSIGENIDHLEITGIIKLDVGGNARFRLPIRNGTDLFGLKITTLDGKPVDLSSYQVSGFKDGTYEVRASLGVLSVLSQTSFIKVTESLIDTHSLPTVRATTRIPSIDINKLSPQALDLLKRSPDPRMPGLWNLRMSVSLGKPYSINPPNKGVLNSVDGSPESFVNAAESLVGSDCGISNGEFALLSSTIADKQYVNVARGYISGTQNGASGGSFLNAAAAHEFTITNDGQILDATASKGTLKGDEMTQQYFKILQGMGEGNIDDVWSAQLEDLMKKQDLQKGIIMLAELGGIALGGYGAKKGFEAIRKRVTREKVHKAKEGLRFKRALRGMSSEQLEEAYRFFNWLSFGGPGEYSRTSQINLQPASTNEMVSNMKKSLLQQNLRDYIRNPQRFESEAGVKNFGRIRRLASYLAS